MNRTSIELLAGKLEALSREAKELDKEIQEKEEYLKTLKDEKKIVLKSCLEIIEDIKCGEDENFVYYHYNGRKTSLLKKTWCLDD